MLLYYLYRATLNTGFLQKKQIQKFYYVSFQHTADNYHALPQAYNYYPLSICFGSQLMRLQDECI